MLQMTSLGAGSPAMLVRLDARRRDGVDLAGPGDARVALDVGGEVAALARILERISDLESQLSEAQGAIRTLRSRLAAAERHAVTDSLTGIANRRGFLGALRGSVTDARRRGQRLSLLMVDVDHFKSFNDQYGHTVGDHVLRLIAAALLKLPLRDKHAARYGGEEFALLLPRNSLGDALEAAEQLRRSIAERRFVMRGTGEALSRVTVSVGVAELRVEESAKHLVRRADAALYRAKRAGRNDVHADMHDACA